MKHTIAAVVAGLLILAALPTPAQAQSRLTGTVTDATGAVIIGAEVKASNVSTGLTYTAVTNATGTYVLPSLPVGEYQLICEFSGFKKVRRGGVILETGYARTLDVALEVGAVTEAVEVKAATPLLESESSSVGQLIERSAVMNMPLESHRSGSLVRLMGNVAFTSEASAEQIPVFSIAGGRGRDQTWYLDGVIDQNLTLVNHTLTMNPPAESLQEFKVEGNNSAAEFGRAGGGLILMTTRSGTNKYHGALYEFLRNDKLDARTFFSPSKAPLRYNIFGTSVGGPIVKNRTFFFFNYEGSRRRTPSTITYVVPHAPEITGDFSRRTDVKVLDPLTATQFPGNTIPASRIDPVGQAFAKLYPAPNIAINDVTGAPRSNYIVNVSDQLNQNFYTTRVDHNVSAKARVYGRYSYVEAPNIAQGAFPNQFADSRATTNANQQHNAMGSWIFNHLPNVMSEVRFVYFQKFGGPHALGTGSGKNGEFGLRGVNEDNLARVSPTGLTAIGSANQQEVNGPMTTIQVPYNLTWVKARHQIKSGFEFRHSSNYHERNNLAGGSFSFTDRATGYGLATLLLGWTTSADILDALPEQQRSDGYAVYIQDDWKVTSKLTLNLGLRWEMDTPYWEESNRQNSFDLHAINPVSGTPGIVTFAGRDGRSKYANNFDKNDFAPRFGFAYRAPWNVVVRGGYGIQYMQSYGFLGQWPTLGFGIIQTFTSPDGGFTPAFRFRDGMPLPVQESLGPGFGAVAVGATTRTSPDFLQQNFPTGYMQQWNLGIQKQLGGNMLAEVAYVGNVGHKLSSTRNASLNMIPLTNGRGPARQDQRLRPFPQFSDVLLAGPPWGNSNFNSLNLKLEKRYSNGLNFMMNYTWSKFLDDQESQQEIGGGAGDYGSGYTHTELRRLDKSLSGNDIRHRYIGSAVYDLPFGHGRAWDISNRVFEKIAGGWRTGVIAEFRDGVPYGVVEQTNHTNTFSASQRPNLVRNPDLGGGRSRSTFIAQYFDTSAFQDPGVGVFGNSPRTICCGPGLASLDFSLQKRFALTEKAGLSFRTDCYNLPNRPNFADPNLSRGNAAFGRISGTRGTARLIQFNLRLEF